MYILDLVYSHIPLLPELWRIIAEIIKQVSGIPMAKTNLVPFIKELKCRGGTAFAPFQLTSLIRAPGRNFLENSGR